MDSCGPKKSVIWNDQESDDVHAGAFDGLTIMRHAPFYRERSSGGVEQLLRCLNRGLLQRHRLTLLQVYRVSDIRNCRIDVEEMAKGRIFWIPVAHKRTAFRFADLHRRAQFVYDQTFPLHWENGGGRQRSLLNVVKGISHGLGHVKHRTVILSNPLVPLLTTHKVDLLAVHGLTYDAEALIAPARKLGIPFLLINHFDNALFSEPQVRKWVPSAAGVGAVSGRCLPDYLRGRCVNLSDAVDTEFFAPKEARCGNVAPRPTILLPAIIKPGKGQEDLLRAARILATRNLDFQVCFAGATESESLREALRREATTAGLEGRVVFLGELCQEEIRDYYARSSIVVLPTYCEGLGRSLLEAQAMHKPVVAYDSGGVGETILPNETGFLVKTGDVETLADRLGYLLENETARSQMGERGRQFVVRRFSVSALIQRHESFYLRALRENSPRAFDKERATTLQG